MKKLKTLQDLEYTNDNCSVPFELREVAREWIKELESKEDLKDYIPLSININKFKIDWIRHFFNLEE